VAKERDSRLVIVDEKKSAECKLANQKTSHTG
jgi:hypothetical protein